MRESFLTSELATSPDCIDWLKYNNKSYLLPDAKKSRHVTVGGQYEGPSILGREKMAQGDQHLLQFHRRTRLSCNLPTAKTQTQSTMEEVDEYGDQHRGAHEYEDEDEDDEESPPQVV
ncbi:hypothetical protein PVK06_011147 [Gossypium arboreum]|uniref:Uncharacterized protein n=1 Tax=Gossypium arboreum TaxID=29729 RepID=A0ABR0Q8Y7_GOSAR|nr:hypothetical protein PVK06_011147 [Gossypium arboreum]